MRGTVAFMLMGLVMENAIGAVKFSPSVSVEWAKQIVEFELPEPFGKVRIQIRRSHGELDDIVLDIGGEQVRFGRRLVMDIGHMDGSPQVSYARDDYDKDKKIDSFKVYIEYGYPYDLDIPATPTCPSPCRRVVTDSVIFTVDRNHQVSRTFYKWSEHAPLVPQK